MTVFLFGILGGVVLSLFFSFGPAFFSQIQASIHYGFRNAVKFAYGVSSSDILIVAILLTVSRNIEMESMIEMLNNRWILYFGAAVIGGFGLYTMFLKTRRSAEVSDTDKINFQNVQVPSHWNIYIRGVVLNFFNPVIWLYWAAMVTIFVCGDSEYTIGERYLFFGGVLSATLSLDILKCKLASLLQRVITYRFLSIFNKCIGLILIGFAIYMAISTTSIVENNSAKNATERVQQIVPSRHVK